MGDTGFSAHFNNSTTVFVQTSPEIQDLTFQSYRSNGLGGIAVNVLVIECMLGLIMDAQESQRLHVSTNYKP